MSKPNVSALISAIRSLKVDLQSLNEFDTGQHNLLYYIFFPKNTYNTYNIQISNIYDL